MKLHSLLSLLLGILLVFKASDAQQLSGDILIDTTLAADLSPWEITGDVTVHDGATLTIEPACTLYVHESAGIKIEAGAKLVAVGTAENRILMTRPAGTDDRWNGIEFDGTREDNLLSCVDILHGDRQPQVIDVHRARVVLDHLTWNSQNRIIVELYHPQAIIQHCTFPSVDQVEVIHGEYLKDDDYLILIGNTFGRPRGYNDVIDYTDCKFPGPVFEAYNNTFLGGGDDGLDLDGADAYIEGNLFLNFHKDHTGTSTSNAIATGLRNGKTSNVYVVRNVFYDNDHAVLLKEDCYMYAENNTFVKSDSGVFNFSEWPYRNVEPGKGADLVGNIFWDYKQVFENQFAQQGETDPQITLNRNLVDESVHYLGENNIDADPQFIDPDKNFYLQPTSPAIGSGPNGLDMGAYVPAGASISGEPLDSTTATSATLHIGGPGIISYQYVLNDPNSAWSKEVLLEDDATVELTDLHVGEFYTLYVRGKNVAGHWQDNPAYATSKTWLVYDPHTDVAKDGMLRPSCNKLYSAYPNPFNAQTRIQFELASEQHVKIEIYDALGRLVHTGLDKKLQAGTHSFDIKAEGRPSGVYFYSMTAGEVHQSKRFVIMR